jgi:hypothetical protein
MMKSIDTGTNERAVGKRSTIANYLRLLKLDPIIQTEFVMALSAWGMVVLSST